MVRRLSFLCALLTAALLGSLLTPRVVQAGAFAPARAGSTLVKKLSDTSRASNTTLTADAELTYSVAASGTYLFRFTLFVYNGNAAGDFQWDVTTPSSPTATQAATLIYLGSISGSGASSMSGTANLVSDNGVVIVEGLLQNGSNAGSLTLTWAQQNSDGTATTLRKGSLLEVVPFQ